MPLSPEELYLAENCYGYGRWEADFWFIGPEQGESKFEPELEGKRVHCRAEAFKELNTDGLCDCYEFHKKIGVDCWHKVNVKTGRVKPQLTWTYLMLVLMAFKEETPDENHRSEYQRTRLGMKDPQHGETCVIELTGLPSKNLKRSKERDKRRSTEEKEMLDAILASRVKNIYCKIRQHNPKFVVMYGFSDKDKKYYGEIAGTDDLKCGVPQTVGKTVFLFDRHPLYTLHEKWIQLGKLILKESELARVV